MIVAPWLGLALLTVLLALPGPAWPELQAESAAAGLLALRFLAGRNAAVALLPACVAALAIPHDLAGRLPAARHGEDVTVTGSVCQFAAGDDRVTRFDLRPDAGEGLPERIAVAWYETDAMPAPGERWRLTLRLREPRGFGNPAGFDLERQLLARGVGARAYVRSATSNARLDGTARHCASGVARARIARAVEHRLEGRRALGYLLALSVGARHRLSDDDWALLRRTGTSHLMAISGLHVGLVAAWGFVLGRLGAAWLPGLRARPGRAGRLCACLAALGYAGLAGFTIPTVRALLMILVAAASPALRDGRAAGQALSVALLAVLFWQPLAPLGGGFWLSFAAVTVLLLPAMRHVPPQPAGRAWLRPFAAFVPAQLRLSVALAVPLVALFGEVSLVAPLANLIAVPLFGAAIVPLTLAGTALAVLGGPDWPLQLAATLVEALLAGLDRLAAPAAAAWAPMPRAGWAVALGLVGTACLAWPGWLPGRWLGGLLVSPVLLGAPKLAPPEELRVVVMDVGQGLAVLVQTPTRALLYDAGPRFATGDAGEAVVLPVLAHFAVGRLDAVVVSHADADHAGGLASVRRRYPAAVVYRPAAAARAIAGAQDCAAGQAWTWDGVEFAFLHPPAELPAPLRRGRNDGSCVLSIRAAGAHALLPGDVTVRAESAVLRRLRPGPLDLLVAPHHGSATSSGAALVAATRPGHVVFSTGYANRWGFPVPEVRRRWAAVDACLLSTARHGAMIFEAGVDRRLALTAFHRDDRAPVWTARAASSGACAAPGEPL